jgi:osmotically-inducible protein OsmY
MRNDMGLQRDVTHELKWDPITRNAEIAVAVKDGVATLGGTVDSYTRKLAAVRAAERVGGIHAVADELTVVLPDAQRHSDTELAHRVLEALRWDVMVPDERITARVEGGWVTLEGDVEWDYQREAATRAVRNLSGVRGLTTLLTLRPTVSPGDVSAHIRAALHRRAQEDLRGIVVETLGSSVILRGTVRSWAEKRDAERAAWAAPGVTRVEDRLVVMV